MASAKDVLKRIKDEEIEWVDLRFTDPKGKWQHLTMVSSILTEDELEEGARGLSVFPRVGGIFTSTTISLDPWLRQLNLVTPFMQVGI